MITFLTIMILLMLLAASYWAGFATVIFFEILFKDRVTYDVWSKKRQK